MDFFKIKGNIWCNYTFLTQDRLFKIDILPQNTKTRITYHGVSTMRLSTVVGFTLGLSDSTHSSS